MEKSMKMSIKSNHRSMYVKDMKIKIYKLKKTLDELKQAPKSLSYLATNDFFKCLHEHTLFFKEGS